MTDREKHISVLQNIDRAYRTFTQEEYRALEYAIASLKTDLKYDLMYEGEDIYTKADMVAMLKELLAELKELPKAHFYETNEFGDATGCIDYPAISKNALDLIQQKINALNDGNIITNIDKFKEVFGNLPVSLDAQKRLVIDDNDIPYGFWEQEYKKEEKK